MSIRQGVSSTFAYQSDAYTAVGSGVIVDITDHPFKTFALQVKATGTTSGATHWDIHLEGSLDGINFTQILRHIKSNGNGTVLFTLASLFPSLYFRSRAVSISLGPATDFVATILGVV